MMKKRLCLLIFMLFCFGMMLSAEEGWQDQLC